MKKYLKLLLLLASIGIVYLIIFFGAGVLAMQDKYKTELKEEKDDLVKLKTVSKTTKKLIQFLENPMDLNAFKEKKKKRFTTSVTAEMSYYFHPKISDAIFYAYYYPNENFIPKKINRVIVFKYGVNKHIYDDKTEMLIELKIFNQDIDLGKANLVGRKKSNLESEFGTNYKVVNNQIIYAHKNNILILELDNEIVTTFNYLKISTENINTDLIRRIIE